MTMREKVTEIIARAAGYLDYGGWPERAADEILALGISAEPADASFDRAAQIAGFAETLSAFLDGDAVFDAARAAYARSLRYRGAVPDARVSDELRRLSEAATDGPWEDDHVTVDFEEIHGRYKARAAITSKGTLFDTVNSTVMDIRTGYDEDGDWTWDEQGERDIKLAVAAVNDVRSRIAAEDVAPEPRPEVGWREGYLKAAALAREIAEAKEHSSRGSLGGMFASQSAADLKDFAERLERDAAPPSSTPAGQQEDGR